MNVKINNLNKSEIDKIIQLYKQKKFDDALILSNKLLKTEKNVPFLYGGSVNRDNATEIMAIDHVSGALVGGASLQAEGFLAIYQAATENCAN